MQELVNFINKRFEQEDLKDISINFISENNNIYLIFNPIDCDESQIKLLVNTENPLELLDFKKCWIAAFNNFSSEYHEYLNENIKFDQNSIFPNGLKYKKSDYDLEYSLTYQNSNINKTPLEILSHSFNFDLKNNEDQIFISKISNEMCFFMFMSSYYPNYFHKVIHPALIEISAEKFLDINQNLENINLNSIFCGYTFTASYLGSNRTNQEVERIIDNCLFELSKKNLVFFRDLPTFYSNKINLDYDNLSVSVDKKYDKNLVALYKSAMSEKVPSRAYLSFYSILDYCTQGLNEKNKRNELKKIISPHKDHIIDELSKKIKDVNFFGKKFTFVDGSEIADFFYHLRNNIYHLDKNHEKKEPYIPYTKIENKIELIIPSIKMLCELLIEFKAEHIN